MVNLNPSLNFPGTAEEAFNFYKSVFSDSLIEKQIKDTYVKRHLNN